MFLDRTYFHGQLSLPILRFREPAVGMAKALQTIGEKSLQGFIDQYEYKYLQLALGNRLAHKFVEGVSSGDSFWDELYTLIYRKEYGRGFSPSANYVYFFAMQDGQSQTTDMGEIRKFVDSSQVQRADRKLLTAWNEMCDQTYHIWSFIRSNWNTYRPHADNYSWFCREIEHENILGI